MNERAKLTRHTLYESVWAQPMTKVAAGLGISDVGLKKVCIRHHVPVPGLGYWAKVAAGKTVTQIPLPPISDSALEEIRIFGASDSKLPPAVRQAKREAIVGEKALEKRITVNSATAAFHPTAALTLKALRKREPDHRGLVTAWEPECFRVSVALENAERAAGVLDAIARAAGERGFAIELTEKTAGLRIDGELIGFGLHEKKDRQPHKRTPEEIARDETSKKARGRSNEYEYRPPEPEWDYVPSGNLVLQLDESYHTGLRRLWADGKKQRVENLLNDFFAGAIAYAAAEKEAEARRERWRREREAIEQRRWAEEERRKLEESRWKFLAGKIESLERAERIERFVEATKAQLTNIDGSPHLDRLLDWSRDYAARLRTECLPENLNDALAEALLFQSESKSTSTDAGR